MSQNFFSYNCMRKIKIKIYYYKNLKITMKSKNNVFHVFCFLIAITNVKVIHAWLARIVAEDMAASFSYHTAL